MQLYFLRHAQSENNLIWEQTRNVEGRKNDPEITPKGHQQAQRLADMLSRPYEPVDVYRDYHNNSGFGLTHIYCSLQTRAIQTASYSAEKLNLPLTALPNIHEYAGIFQYHVDGERWVREPLEGQKRSYFEERFPHLMLPDSVDNDFGWWEWRHERRSEMAKRGREAVAWLKENHEDDARVAIVSHGGFYQAFMYALLQFPPLAEGEWLPASFSINNCGVTRVNIDNGHAAILYSNKTDHLPPELHTR